jgi:hypothetical protein
MLDIFQAKQRKLEKMRLAIQRDQKLINQMEDELKYKNIIDSSSSPPGKFS